MLIFRGWKRKHYARLIPKISKGRNVERKVFGSLTNLDVPSKTSVVKRTRSLASSLLGGVGNDEGKHGQGNRDCGVHPPTDF